MLELELIDKKDFFFIRIVEFTLCFRIVAWYRSDDGIGKRNLRCIQVNNRKFFFWKKRDAKTDMTLRVKTT